MKLEGQISYSDINNTEIAKSQLGTIPDALKASETNKTEHCEASFRLQEDDEEEYANDNFDYNEY